jgi:hypothetical protein
VSVFLCVLSLSVDVSGIPFFICFVLFVCLLQCGVFLVAGVGGSR